MKIERDISLDLLKTISIFLVILIHISATGFVVFGPQWKAALVYESIARISVPIFFMVTGATQLRKYHDITSILKKIKVVIIPLVAWSIIYILFDRYYFGTITHSWLVAIIQGPVRHLWYLYALIGAYFFLPLTSKFYQNSSTNEKLWVIVGWIIGSSILPMYKDLTGQVLTSIDMSYIPIYSGYMLAGAFLYDYVDTIHKSAKVKVVAAAGLAGVLNMVFTGYFTYKLSIYDNHYSLLFFNYYSISVLFSAISTFLIITLIYKNKEKLFFNKPITYIGSSTFGVYVSHMIVITYIQQLADLAGPMSRWFWYILVTALTLFTSLILVSIIKRLPYLRSICP